MVMKQNPSSSPSVRRSSLRALAIAAASLALAACGGGGGKDDNGSPTDPDVWHFRAVNAIGDAPQVQFYVDDTPVVTAEYGAVTDYKPAHTGSRPVKVGIRNASQLGTADPGYTDIGTEQSYDFQGPTDYTLVSAGTVASPRQFLITDTSRADVDDNEIEYQVINAATGAGTLDVYITATSAGIDAAQRVDVLALGEYSDKDTLDVEIPTGGTADTTRSTPIIFEVRSGASVIYRANAFTVSEKTRLLVVITDNVGALGASPVKLMVIGGIAAGAASVMPNRTDPGELRLANASPDAGLINLIVGTSAADLFASDVPFGGASDYMPLPVGTYNAIGTPFDNDGVFLFVNSIVSTAGRSATLYGQGPLGSMRGVLLTDERRSVPSEARFRFTYLAPSQNGSPVSLYLTRHGVALDLNATTPPTPNLTSLTYLGVSSQLILDGGSYDAYFTRVGSKDILLGPVNLVLADGSVQTLALADTPEGELALVPFDDARE